MVIYWKGANKIEKGTVLTVSEVSFPKKTKHTMYHVKMPSGFEMDVSEESIIKKEE